MKKILVLLFLLPFIATAVNGSSIIKQAGKIKDNNQKIKFLKTKLTNTQLKQIDQQKLALLLADTYTNEAKYNSSIEILNKFKGNKLDSTHALCNYKIARNYTQINNYDSSIYYLFKVIGNKKTPTNYYLKAHILLGYLYILTEQFDLGEKYLLKANQLCQKHDTVSLIQIHSNLGQLYFKKNDYDKALYYYLKEKKFSTNTTSLEYQMVLSNIGATYVNLKQANKALPYVSEAYQISLDLGDKLGELICINNFATIYRDLNQENKALFYYEKALSMVDELGSKEEKKIILFNLSELYEKKGQLDKAYKYFKKYHLLKEQLINSERNRFIVETQEKYDANERKREIAELKIREQIKDARNLKMIYAIVIGLILIIFSSLIIFLRIRSKNREEKTKNKLAIITATMEAEENERLRISQEIHDDLGGVLGMSRMLFSTTKNYLIDKNAELYKMIDDLLNQANNRSRSISHELFSPTLKQFGLEPAIKEHIQNIKAIHLDLEMDFKMKRQRFNPQLELNLFRITQELLNNTLKHAQAQKITLNIIQKDQTIYYNYTDNGVGFDEKNLKKGVGFNSITNRILQFKGDVKIQSPENKGFNIEISIPIQ